MRGSHQHRPRVAASFNSRGNIQSFLINRDRDDSAIIQSKNASSEAVPGFFHPNSVSRFKQRSSTDVERLLRTADDHDLVRRAAYAACCCEIDCDGFAQAL